jgi:hypothetical protein
VAERSIAPYGRLVSMGEVIAGLNAVLDHLDRARERLTVGQRAWASAAQVYRDTLRGSQQQEPRDIDAISTTLDDATLQRIFVAVFTAESAIKRLLRSYGGQRTSQSISTRPSASQPSGSQSGITNRHGDRYPAEAVGLIEDLPPRVVPRSGGRTVGVPRVAGKVAAPIESGYDPDLSEAIAARLDQLGIRSTYWADTCDKVLDLFLPPGFVLTVHGTTRDNRPWRKTYGTRRRP